MNRSIALSALFGLLAISLPILTPQLTQAQTGHHTSVTKPQIQALGAHRYRIGHIEVDQATHRFTVPGVVLRHDPPLEFLAVATGGMKGYESLLELQSTAYEFNLACILIGLDAAQSTTPRYHFDPEPAKGQALTLWVTWHVDGKSKRVKAADMIQIGAKTMPRDAWVYTGSTWMPNGYFMAHEDGTLIGFVHDPSSLIEHQSGFGIGEYGGIAANRSLVPPVGTQVTLIVERQTRKKTRKGNGS